MANTVMNQKLNALADAVDQAFDSGEINVAELERLVSEVRRESSTPVFVQAFKRERGISPAPTGAPFQPHGGVTG